MSGGGMQVQRYDDVSAFYDRVCPYLVEREFEHVLHLGLINTMRLTGMPAQPPYMAVAERDGRIAAVMLRMRDWRGVLSNMTDPAAMDALATDIYTAAPDMPGVFGKKAELAAFMGAWQRLTPLQARINRAERLFQIREVNPVRGVSGRYRLPTPDDYPLIVDWLIAFEIEADPANPGNPDRAVYEKGVKSRCESDPMIRGYRLWEDDGEVVSLAGHSGPTPNGIRIGPVYTPPDKRGHGYASAVTATLTQELLDQGRSFVALFTDLANPTSNKIYQQIGYRPVCDVDEYIFQVAKEA